MHSVYIYLLFDFSLHTFSKHVRQIFSQQVNIIVFQDIRKQCNDRYKVVQSNIILNNVDGKTFVYRCPNFSWLIKEY